MKKILISGFGPFDEGLFNPSEDWVNWMLEIESELCQAGFLQGVILPVAFMEAFTKLKEEFDRFNPDIIILTGLAKNRKHLSVERIGINWADFRIPDNSGIQIKNTKIDPVGPDGLFSTVSMEKLKEIDSQLVISTSAGEYVCNEILYRSLNAFKDVSKEITFFHLPGLPNREDYNSIFNRLQKMVRSLL